MIGDRIHDQKGCTIEIYETEPPDLELVRHTSRLFTGVRYLRVDDPRLSGPIWVRINRSVGIPPVDHQPHLERWIAHKLA